ncbi:hypothetical protein [Halocatena pleomorpha]|uniref:Uncharacterized protein n=1 Tax=Halocatena pleomorpha TaxID=1785090 RepID=A0A3P3R5J8_9EURY|nr:hypothetical protein [Halocatena pleomorpha]RRJ28645.1 hypothetical protein EIK79_15255 [Halocatena pleomorpha]
MDTSFVVVSTPCPRTVASRRSADASVVAVVLKHDDADYYLIPEEKSDEPVITPRTLLVTVLDVFPALGTLPL